MNKQLSTTGYKMKMQWQNIQKRENRIKVANNRSDVNIEAYIEQLSKFQNFILEIPNYTPDWNHISDIISYVDSIINEVSYIGAYTENASHHRKQLEKHMTMKDYSSLKDFIKTKEDAMQQVDLENELRGMYLDYNNTKYEYDCIKKILIKLSKED
jgi:hypothetical protein